MTRKTGAERWQAREEDSFFAVDGKVAPWFLAMWVRQNPFLDVDSWK